MLPRRYPLVLLLRVRGESRTVDRFCFVDDRVGCCSQVENTMGFDSALFFFALGFKDSDCPIFRFNNTYIYIYT